MTNGNSRRKRSDLYFIRLKDSSSLVPVERDLLDNNSDYFRRQTIHDYQLSQLNIINLETTLRATFENVIYCLKRDTFPDNKYATKAAQLKAIQEAFLEAEALCTLESHMRSLLSKDTCIIIWQLTYKSSQYLRNLAIQAFAYTCCFFSHQLYHNREVFCSLKPREILTILKSPYLCLLDPTMTFHLIGNYFVITILTLIEVWSENRVNLDKTRLIEELNLPPSVRMAIKSYHEDHDPRNELSIISNYKFSSLGFIVYYPSIGQVPSSPGSKSSPIMNLQCPSSQIDPKRWTLKSLEFFMDLRERFIVGCRQSFKNIWMDIEESVVFGNVDTKKTAPGGYLEVGPGEAITGVQLFRTFVAANDSGNSNHQCVEHNRNMYYNSGCSGGEIVVLPYFNAVITRCCFTITTYACSSIHTFPRMGLRRQVSLPSLQTNRFDLDEPIVSVDISEVRDNCLSTASHLFGLAVNFSQSSSQDKRGKEDESTGLTDVIPVWSAADGDALANLKKYMQGIFCCANDLREHQVLMSDSFSNKISRRHSEMKKPLTKFPDLSRKPMTMSRNNSLTRPSSSLEKNTPTMFMRPLHVRQSSKFIHDSGTLPSNVLGSNFAKLSLEKRPNLFHNSLERLPLLGSVSDSENINQMKKEPSSKQRSQHQQQQPKRRVVFSKNHYLHHFTPDSSSTETPSPRYYQIQRDQQQPQQDQQGQSQSPRIPKNYLSCFEDSDSCYGFNQTPPASARRQANFNARRTTTINQNHDPQSPTSNNTGPIIY